MENESTVKKLRTSGKGFVLAALVISSCVAYAQAIPNISGNWNVTAHSIAFNLSVQAAGQINQSGNSLSGQMFVAGSPCVQYAAFTGTILANRSITISFNESGQIVVFSGTLSSDGRSASGTYSAPSGGCTNGDRGTWTGTQLSSPGGVHPIPSISVAISGGAPLPTTPFGDPLASGAFVTLFGSNLADQPYTASGVPWPTTLGPTTVIVCDIHANCTSPQITYYFDRLNRVLTCQSLR